MPCALTQGYVIDCRDAVGGLKESYFIELQNMGAVTVTAGVVTAIAKATGKQFRRYELVKETGSAKETLAQSVENGTTFYNQELAFPLNKLQANTRNEIVLLAQNSLSAVVVDRNGKGWLYGQTRGLDLTGMEAGTGTAAGDRNGYMLTFTGIEPVPALEVAASVLTTLTTPGT